MSITLTENEILEALRVALEPSDEGLTSAQIGAALGIRSAKIVRELLARQIASGLIVAGRAWRTAIDGTRRSVPVYRVKR